MMSIKHYTDPELLEINTLENAIYMAMQNDVSFMIGLRLSLYEHQSTFNPNLPLRYLFYISDLYSGMIDKNKLYGSRKILIPPPEFVIFYNGIQPSILDGNPGRGPGKKQGRGPEMEDML